MGQHLSLALRPWRNRQRPRTVRLHLRRRLRVHSRDRLRLHPRPRLRLHLRLCDLYEVLERGDLSLEDGDRRLCACVLLFEGP